MTWRRGTGRRRPTGRWSAAAFDTWRAGTRAISDIFATDMVWRIEGHSLASTEYHGKQEFLDAVLTPFGARFRTAEPFRPVVVARSSPTRTR